MPALAPEALAAWTAFLRAHASITRELEGRLQEAHGLTLSDYDVLVQLREAGRGLRPVELSRAVLLTRSGVTRLVQGLERAGLVERVNCPDDQRGRLVQLTDAGRAVLRRATRTHLDGVRALFADRLEDSELTTVAAVLIRLA